MKLGLLWMPCSTCMNLGLWMQQGKAPPSLAPFCWRDKSTKWARMNTTDTALRPGEWVGFPHDPCGSLMWDRLWGLTLLLAHCCAQLLLASQRCAVLMLAHKDKDFSAFVFSFFLFTISKESILIVDKRLLILLSSALPILYHNIVIMSLCTVIALSFLWKWQWSHLVQWFFFSVTNNWPPKDGMKLELVFLLLGGEHKQWHTLNIDTATQGLSQASYTHHTETFISQLFRHCYMHTHNSGKHPLLDHDLAKITAAFIRRWLPDIPLTPGIRSEYHRSTLTLPQPPQPCAHIAYRRQALYWSFKYL